MKNSFLLLICLSIFVCIGCSSEKYNEEECNINDVSGNYVYTWGYPGYEPSTKVELLLDEWGTYSLSTKDGDKESFEVGYYEVGKSKLILNSNEGVIQNCSFTNGSIKMGKYFLDKQLK